jgi:hypothetical protein
MTEEELRQKAEDSLSKSKRMGTMGYLKRDNVDKPYTDGYIAGAKENGIQWHKVADGDLPKKKGLFFYRDLHAKEKNRYVNYGITNDKELLEYFDEWAEIAPYEDKE